MCYLYKVTYNLSYFTPGILLPINVPKFTLAHFPFQQPFRVLIPFLFIYSTLHIIIATCTLMELSSSLLK